MKLLNLIIMFSIVLVDSQIFDKFDYLDKQSDNKNDLFSIFNSISNGKEPQENNNKIEDIKINSKKEGGESIKREEKKSKNSKPLKLPSKSGNKLYVNEIDKSNKFTDFDKEIKPLTQIIDKNKKDLFEIAEGENEILKLQKTEIQNLEKQFIDVRQKTMYLDRLISENKIFKEMKVKFGKNSKDWEKCSIKFLEINSDISNLKEDIQKLLDKVNENEKFNHLNEILSNTQTENSEIQNYLHAENLFSQNLITSVLNLDKTKLSENLVELDNNLKLNLNGENYLVKELIEFNKFFSKVRNVCADLSCLMSIEELNEQEEKNELITNTIITIKSHLDSL